MSNPERPRWLTILDRCSVAFGSLAWAAVVLVLAPAYTAGASESLGALGADAMALILGLAAGYLLADLFSGLVHWLADRYFDPRTPILGPALIEPFREHHQDALAMTKHDFFETSGNNTLVTLPLAFGLLLLPTPTGSIGQFCAASVVGLGLSIIATNQFHSWAHVDHPPRLAVRLQAWGLILSPDRHALHHSRDGAHDHDRSYCVTSGWLNPLLDRIEFFARLERTIEKLTGHPRRATGS